MSMKRSRSAISNALRDVRFDLRLNQSDFADTIGVTRATISAWEVGKTLPPFEQRVRTLDALANAVPAASYDALTLAFGLARRGGPGTVRDASSVRRAATAALRAAADDLDVASSFVRRAILAVAKRMREESLGWAEIEATLADTKPDRSRER